VQGCAGGAILGFANGYLGAIRGSVKFLVGGATKLLHMGGAVSVMKLVKLGSRRFRNVLYI